MLSIFFSVASNALFHKFIQEMFWYDSYYMPKGSPWYHLTGPMICWERRLYKVPDQNPY